MIQKNVLFSLLAFLLASFSFASCEALRPITASPDTTLPAPLPLPDETPETVVSDPDPGTTPVAVPDIRKDVTSFAQQYVGKPYKYGGKNPSGFDCSGFTYYVMQQFEVPLPGNSRAQEEVGRRIRPEEAQPGDLLFFRRSQGGAVFHVALVLSNDERGLKVVHATSSRGVVIDVIQDSSYWREKYITARNVLAN